MRKMFLAVPAWLLAGSFLWAQDATLKTNYSAAWKALRTKNKHEVQKTKTRPTFFKLKPTASQTPILKNQERYYPMSSKERKFSKIPEPKPLEPRGQPTARAVTAWAPRKIKNYRSLYEDPEKP